MATLIDVPWAPSLALASSPCTHPGQLNPSIEPWRAILSLCKPGRTDHHDEDLAATCERLAAIPLSPSTPNSSRDHYYPLLCVRRWRPATSVVVDSLAPGIDLKPFFI